jgi:hypothetical protein
VTSGERVHAAHVNESTSSWSDSPQRLEKPRSEPLSVIGAQRGECLDEAGIVRIDDH